MPIILLYSLACISKTFQKCDWPKNKHFFISLKIEFEISFKLKIPHCICLLLCIVGLNFDISSRLFETSARSSVKLQKLKFDQGGLIDTLKNCVLIIFESLINSMLSKIFDCPWEVSRAEQLQ